MKFYKENFKRIREGRGKTFDEIANALGISKQAIEHYEYGNNKPRPKRVYALAKCLGVSVIDISDLPPEDELIKKTNHLDPCPEICRGLGDIEKEWLKRFAALPPLVRDNLWDNLKRQIADAEKKSDSAKFTPPAAVNH